MNTGESDVRGRELRRSMGRAALQVRSSFGWTQRELARRVGCSQSMISRFERGTLLHVDVDFADAVFDELGIRTSFDTRLPGIADRRRQRDRVHARCCAFLGRNLIDWSWDVRHEVEVGSGRYRGWIDLLAFRRVDRALFCPEVKTEIHDAGAIQRTLAWYEREAWAAARRFGWTPRRLSSGLLLLSTSENDDGVAANRELFRQSFPGSAASLASWLRDPAAPLPARSIAMVDPRSRRIDWLRPTRLDGRRSAAPYRDYAEVAALLG